MLQAADVLAYRAGEVPVGEDQREHLELMRDVARRFNARFGEDVLVVPEHRIPRSARGSWTSRTRRGRCRRPAANVEGTVYVLDEPQAIEKKLKRAVTDSGDAEIRRGPDKPGVTNLVDILAAPRGDDAGRGRGATCRRARLRRPEGGDGRGGRSRMLAPVRERYEELRPDEDALEEVLAAGADRARAIAAGTLADVRAAMGVGPRAA